MKRAVIDIRELFKLRIGVETNNFIESKLKEAGFDMNEHIISIVDAVNMTYIYTQE